MTTTTTSARWALTHVDRSGRVTIGRYVPGSSLNRNQRTLGGFVRKVRGGWANDLCSTIYPTQSAAALAIVRIVNGPVA